MDEVMWVGQKITVTREAKWWERIVFFWRGRFVNTTRTVTKISKDGTLCTIDKPLGEYFAINFNRGKR